MPDPRQAPDDGRWQDGEGRLLPAGTYLPAPLDKAMSRIYLLYKQYPEICQAHLNAVAEIELTRCRGKMAIQEAQYMASAIRGEVAEDPGWPTWAVVAGSVFAALVGAGVGYGLGVVTVRR